MSLNFRLQIILLTSWTECIRKLRSLLMSTLIGCSQNMTTQLVSAHASVPSYFDWTYFTTTSCDLPSPAGRVYCPERFFVPPSFESLYMVVPSHPDRQYSPQIVRGGCATALFSQPKCSGDSGVTKVKGQPGQLTNSSSIT